MFELKNLVIVVLSRCSLQAGLNPFLNPLIFPKPQVYSRIIGMFELNNLALVVQSPVENYFLAIDELPEDEKRNVEPVTKPLLDALGRSYSAHCEGTAFYTLQVRYLCKSVTCSFESRLLDEFFDG